MDTEVVNTVGFTTGTDCCFADTDENFDDTPAVLVMHCYKHSIFCIPGRPEKAQLIMYSEIVNAAWMMQGTSARDYL